MLTLVGVAIVILGFALRLNPLLVVVAAALATGFAAGLDLVAIVSEFGRAFTQNRYMALVWLTLPVIGMLEKNGLKERAQALIAKVGGATTGRVLTLYLFIRQITASLGLTAFGGHAAMVRPLVAPMAEAAAENQYGELPAGYTLPDSRPRCRHGQHRFVLRRGHLHRDRLCATDQGLS